MTQEREPRGNKKQGIGTKLSLILLNTRPIGILPIDLPGELLAFRKESKKQERKK